MKKICIFTGYFLPHLGGIERYVDKLSLALKDKNHEIIIVTSNHLKTKNFENREGIKIYKIPIFCFFKKRYPIPKINLEYFKIIKKVKSENANYYIVNTRFHLTSLIGAKIAKKQKKPVFLIEHGTNHFTVNNKILDFFGHIYEHILTRIIKRYVNNYYGVSMKCNEWLEHFNIKASGVFYNSISLDDQKEANNDYFKKYNKNNIIISYVGRLIKEKGILNLIKAFEEVDYENKRLLIAGDGNLLKEIRKNYSKSKNIDILGKLNFMEVMSLYKRTDIFVCPSLYPEGLPTSILEAGLMKCAVLATPMGGTKEVIKDDRYGIITNGSIYEMKEKLEELISNSEKRKTCGENLFNRVAKDFNWQIVAKKVIEEFIKLGE